MTTDNDKLVKTAIKFAVGLITAWIAFFLFLVSRSATCSPEQGSTTTLGWWDSHVGCLPLNSIGDALSGTFAPLAFALLLVTVLLQVQQIKLTREQLGDTEDALNFERSYGFFEKQINVYNALRTLQLEYVRSQAISENSRTALVSVERLSRHLFGKEVADWIIEINDRSALIDQAVAEKQSLKNQIAQRGGGYGPSERDRLEALSNQEASARAWLQSNLTATAIDSRLNKLMKPPRVKPPTA